jgi:hypothetical protein
MDEVAVLLRSFLTTMTLSGQLLRHGRLPYLVLVSQKKH